MISFIIVTPLSHYSTYQSKGWYPAFSSSEPTDTSSTIKLHFRTLLLFQCSLLMVYIAKLFPSSVVSTCFSRDSFQWPITEFPRSLCKRRHLLKRQRFQFKHQYTVVTHTPDSPFLARRRYSYVPLSCLSTSGWGPDKCLLWKSQFFSALWSEFLLSE